MRSFPALLVVFGVAALVTTACHASHPFQPSSMDPVRVVAQYDFAGGRTHVGEIVFTVAYSVTADDAYRDVTQMTTWSSSNPGILRASGISSRAFTAAAQGVAELTATYQGMTAVLVVTVFPVESLPYLRIVTPGPRVPGETASAYLNLALPPVGGVQDVTTQATWASANPDIATVRINGPFAEIKAVRPGTTAITAAYNGLSTSYAFSVHPAFQ